MPIETETSACPGREALRGLIHGGLPNRDQARLTGHLDDCSDCQAEMERLAAEGDETFSGVVRHIDRATPPKDSAYWSALAAAELAVTQSLGHDGSPLSVELKLDFLKPTENPDYIGRIAHFEIRRLIGRGGMGAVLHAHDPNLNRDVAVKILDPQLANNTVARQRFCREARAAASVSHDNLVSVFQVDELSGTELPFLVMQLVNGETLEQRVKRVGKLAVADAVRIGAQAAAGLAAAHAIGLVHRDIKPANILLESGTDKVKLTDFGLARGIEDMRLTRTGFVAGTPLYMAPEQARGEDVDHRVDLFSLGSVLYETLAGKPPFDGKTPLAVLRRIADDEHESIGRVNREVPDWLEEVIDKLLAKNPDDRYQSAAEVAELLAARVACVESAGESEAACPLTLSASKLVGRRRRPRLVLAAAMAGPFLLGGLIGGLGTWYLAPRTVEVPHEVVKTVHAPPLPAALAEPVGPKEATVMRGTGGAILAATTTPDGKKIALGQENGQISLFDATGKLLTTLSKHTGPVWSVDFTADGTQLVSASDDGKVRLWDLATGRVERTITLPSSVRAAAISSTTNYIVTGDRSGLVCVWDPKDENDKPLRQWSHGAMVNAVAFAPDGLTVASAGSDHSIVVWEYPQEPNGLKRLTLRQHQGPVYGLSFSPDGDWLASAGWDQSVIVWNLMDGSVVREIKMAHEEGVWGVAFACCGKVLATAGQEGIAKIWDAASGTELARFDRHKGTVHVARFIPDGTALLTAGRDGTARLYAIDKKGLK